MSAPETCPRCASPVRADIPDVGIQFECAAIALESGHFSEALPCVMRQRDQLAQAHEIIRQLREAGFDLHVELVNARHRLRLLGYSSDLPGEQAMKRWGKLTQ